MSDVIDVAIVGSGPAGLSAAMELRRRGVERVVVLERDGVPGGVPRHCGHPPFGFWEFGRIWTGPRYARELAMRALAAGVEIRVRHTVVGLYGQGLLDVVSPQGRERLQARRVILATGAREAPRSVRLVSGERPIGVINTGALQAYIHLNGILPFRRPIIVGTELVSLSALATCRSHGIKPVAVIEANPRATARWPLTLFPHLLGIPVHYGTDLVEIQGSSRVERVAVSRKDGTERSIACDGVLFTGQFLPEASLLRSSSIEYDAASGGPSIDQDGRCSDPAYFAAGNLLRPIETAGWSYREGKAIAAVVADDLEHGQRPVRRQIKVTTGSSLKYVVPQRITQYEDELHLPRLQLRTEKPIKGYLEITANGTKVARCRINTRAERRILVKRPALVLSTGVTALKVDFVD